MTHQAPTAVIVVDRSGKNGICSNCGKPADIDVTYSCGARVTGVAINANLITGPTRWRALAINDKCPSGLECIGAGRIVEKSHGTEFEQTHRLTDLA